MPKAEITIYDIARELDISTASVSRALHGQNGVSQALRLKVKKTAEKLGYRKNTFASNLRSLKTRTIGVIIPRIRSEFMANVIAGIEQGASEAGYNTMITNSRESLEKEQQNADSLFNNRVDGILVSISSETSRYEHFKPFFQKKIPVVFFDRVLDLKQATCVIIDNQKSAYEIVCYLLKKGHKRIAHITGSQQLAVYRNRLTGYKDALQKAGRAYEENLVFINDLTKQSAGTCADRLSALDPLPDAVFAANDRVAVCCIQRFKEKGLKIPDDIAVAGFNNDFIARIVEPRLTTVEYPAYEMGQVAVRNLLLKMQTGQPKTIPRQIVLNSELVVGKSA